jgi:hypothetical protein
VGRRRRRRRWWRRFAGSKLRVPARKAVDLMTPVVSMVRGRHGFGKEERPRPT